MGRIKNSIYQLNHTLLFGVLGCWRNLGSSIARILCIEESAWGRGSIQSEAGGVKVFCVILYEDGSTKAFCSFAYHVVSHLCLAGSKDII